MRAARLVALAGVASVVLVVIAFVIGGESPNGDDPVGKVVSFYEDNDGDQIIAAVLLVWSAAAFVLFASGLWRMLRDAEPVPRGASALVLVGATLYAAGAGIFAGLTFTLGDFADDLSAQSVQLLNALNQDMFPTLALGVFTFLIGAGASILATATLPKWLGWAAVVVAIAALTPAGFFAFLALGVWILVASGLIATREPVLAV